MAKIVTVQGANSADEETRLQALEQLNDLPTIVLQRLAELSNSKKAQNYFTNSLLFMTVKSFLK
jgi:hypothetical protein